MLAFFCALHVLPIFKTLCLTPRNGVNKKSAFVTSALGWLLGKDEKTQVFDLLQKEQSRSVPPLKTSLFSSDYVISSIFFIIMSVRAVSFPGWSFNWYQWHFRFCFKFLCLLTLLQKLGKSKWKCQFLHGNFRLYAFYVICVCFYSTVDHLILCIYKSQSSNK